MLLIPTIHLREGRCVDALAPDKVLADDPVALVAGWADTGISRIQVNDLDDQAENLASGAALISEICAAASDVEIQVGGMVREEDAVQAYLEAGARYVVIGMRALSAPHLLRDLCLEYPGHVLVALQTRDGKLDADGWSKLAYQDAVEVGQHLERDGVETIIYRDVGSADGGFNLEATRRFARELTIPVLAAGPASGWKSLDKLGQAEEDGVAGAVFIEGLPDDAVDLAAALALTGNGD